MAGRGPEPVRVDGLKELRRTLKKLDPVSAKALTKELKGSVGPIIRDARGRVKVRTGKHRDAMRPFAQGARVGVRLPLPSAELLNWGGTISPKGHPITFPRTEFLTKPAEKHRDEIPDAIGDAIERVWERG